MWERVRKALLASLSVSSMRLWKWVRAFWSKNGLLTLSMLSVATGCLLGFLLRALELTELVRCWGQDGSEGDGAGPAVGAATEGHGHKGKGFCPRKGLLVDGFCLWPFFFFFSPQKLQDKSWLPLLGVGALGQTLSGCRSLQEGWGWEEGAPAPLPPGVANSLKHKAAVPASRGRASAASPCRCSKQSPGPRFGEDPAKTTRGLLRAWGLPAIAIAQRFLGVLRC